MPEVRGLATQRPILFHLHRRQSVLNPLPLIGAEPELSAEMTGDPFMQEHADKELVRVCVPAPAVDEFGVVHSENLTRFPLRSLVAKRTLLLSLATGLESVSCSPRLELGNQDGTLLLATLGRGGYAAL